ncbi:MAG: uroporphyrinogen decarboxylase family protein [Candidatus Hermodarchaeota archaeon]
MVLSKRERVIRTFEHEEPDMVPIHNMGFEHTSKVFQEFLQSKERENFITKVENKFSNIKYLITEQRFWNLDIIEMDPFGLSKLKIKVTKAPAEYPDGCRINTLTGVIRKNVKQVDTGLDYSWYVDGHFKKPEILHSFWDKYGKPIERINNRINYSPQLWEGFVDAVSPYFYPMVLTPINMVEELMGGLTVGRVAYFMRKNPQFIHEVMNEYTKANLEIIKRLNEAGVDIFFYGDDLAYKGSSFISIENYRKFFLPYHRKIYQECKKNGMFVIHHSDGYIDDLVPDMVDAGLDCIQSLEAPAGVNLEKLKNDFGDRLSFMGGMDHTILGFGSPKDIEQEVIRCIRAAAQGGGYFAGPSHTILNAPWQNILAFRAAIEKYRKYPLIV